MAGNSALDALRDTLRPGLGQAGGGVSPNPYNALKALTRTGEAISAASIGAFIDGLEVSEGVKAELRGITPHSYVGR